MEEKEELTACYKPLHAAYKMPNLHIQRLSHLLLVNYLPSEVSRCSLLFISLRDLFAQKILFYLLNLLCDTEWLNTTLTSYLISNPKSISEPALKNNSQKNYEEQVNFSSSLLEKAPIKGDCFEPLGEKVATYCHTLSAISEESSYDLSVVDSETKADRGKVPSKFVPRLSGIESRGFTRGLEDIPEDEQLYNTVDSYNAEEASINQNLSYERTTLLCQQKIDADSQNHKHSFENAEDLIKFIRKPRNSGKLAEDSVPSVHSALRDFISTTAVPLLPDSTTSFPSLQPLPSKMWISPVEEKDILAEMTPKRRKKNIIEGIIEEKDILAEMMPKRRKKNPFKKNIIEGIKEEDYKRLFETLIQKQESEYYCSHAEDLLKRSKSLSNLACESALSSSEILENSGKLSLSSESIHWKNSYSDELQEKHCRKLIKMNSFDKNDGTDSFSIETNQLSEEMKESANTNLSSKSCDNMPIFESARNDKEMEFIPEDEHEKMATDSNRIAEEEMNEESSETSDLSPIYEESENLASTIAKLR